MQSTSVRIDIDTHRQLQRLASEYQTTIGNTIKIAVRSLRQERLGADLSHPLRDDETAWLDTEFG